ncbi:glycosyltransferase family 2 protein [Chondrinema litorale]|uniref:glycosyltransferase family 2 protein n=1 Tax=Chondrinema litorale TaxID=2994555 RepID=UPI0025430BE7|nr:glycosyltransferase family 2 protein [Chondrinema litorale]UZR92354.1 glycosyltransferase family 2 protein [Chondrinema litorale]
MVKLSVVVITFNEEKNIGRCLASVKDIADEIVVIDSFSTDKTEEISLEHGASFIKNAFEGHIEQKNYAITQATYPHILSLDADEALSDELKKSILAVKQNFEHDGYFFNRLSNYCGKWIKHGRWYPDKKLRLWDSRKGKWAGLNPHDKFEMQEGCKTSWIKGDLLHYTFYNIAQHTLQIHKFTNISSQASYQKGKKVNLLKILVKPTFKFFADYVLRRGFLDGYYGLVIAILGAQSKFMQLVKLHDIYKSKKAN